MANVLVLYYSAYGHIERMAQAIAEGARSAAGTEVTVKRVPELVPEDLARNAGMKLDQKAPIVSVDELPSYDAIIFGTPTRFGNMTAQMRNFLDQTGGLWVKGALVGKVASVFASTATQHGGQETTITSFRRLSTAYRERAGRSSLPGQARRRDRRQTRAWCRRAWTDTKRDAESNGDSGRHGRSAVKEAN